MANQKLLEIKNSATLDEIWDLCVRNVFYDKEKYINRLLKMFDGLGINTTSKIADLSAGGGFPAQDLIKLGYNVDCFDGFADELFNTNATEVGLQVKCQKVLWDKLPNIVKPNTYDFAFCRGNSFIYAGGGWDSIKTSTITDSITQFEATMKIFASLIKKGGHIYIDKFKDNELGHSEKVASLMVEGQSQDLLFSSKRFPKEKVRQVFMERLAKNEVVKSEQRITYDLTSEELESIVQKSGFSEIKLINIPEERHFDVWLAKK